MGLVVTSNLLKLCAINESNPNTTLMATHMYMYFPADPFALCCAFTDAGRPSRQTAV